MSLPLLIFNSLKQKWPKLLVLAIANMALALGMGAVGLQFAGIADSALASALAGFAMMILFRFLVTGFAENFRLSVYTSARKNISHLVFSSTHKHIHRFSKAEVLDRLTTDAFNFIDAVATAMVHGLADILMLICTLSFLAYIFPKGLFLVAGSLVLFASVSLITRRRIIQESTRSQQLASGLFVMEKNFVEGHEYLKASGYLGSYFKRLEVQMDEWQRSEGRKLTALNMSETFAWSVRLAFVLVLTGSVAQRMGVDTINFYWLFLAISALSQIYWSFSTAARMLPHYRRCQMLVSEQGDENKVVSPNFLISAEDLLVSFDPRTKSEISLGPISFKLELGDYLWLAGPSGSGKTTLIRTLLGLRNAHTGQLEMPAAEYKTAYVEQDPFFFEGEPLWINLGLQSAAEIPAQQIAGLNLSQFFRALPDGLNTLIGAEGVMPSRGQRVRLAILRALLQHPSVLILDEPTAGLDEKNATEVLRQVRRELSDGVLIIADHRSDLVISSHPTHKLSLPDGHFSELVVPSSNPALVEL